MFDHPKFDANASNLVLMPKKTGGVQFYFFLNHVLRKIGRTPREPTGKTPSIFLLNCMKKSITLLENHKYYYIIIIIVVVVLLKSVFYFC
jgi:hypothetical protein